MKKINQGWSARQSLTSLCVILILCLIISCSRKPGPEAALKLFVNSVVQKKWDTVWDLLSYQSQKLFEDQVFNPVKMKFKATSSDVMNEKHPELGISIQDLLDMSAKEFFILNMEKTDMREKFLKALNPDTLEVEKVTVSGEVARLKIRGRAKDITLVREQGAWRVVLFGSE